MKEKLCYCYKVENISDEKSALAEISKINGVLSCQIVDGVLFYEISPLTNEYDILVASMNICEAFGGELIVGEENLLEENVFDSYNDGEALDENIGSNIDEAQEIIEDNQPIAEDLDKKDEKFEEIKESETLYEKRKKLKKDILMRGVELSLSLILFIVACFIPSSGNQVFTVNSILLILAFAVSVYEIFYFMFIAISKKKFYDTTIVLMLACISMVLFGGLREATLISIIYSLILSISECSKRQREIMLAELYDLTENDEDKAIEKAKSYLAGLESEFAKGAKARKIVGYISLLIIVFSFFCLIPALKLSSYVSMIIGVAVLLTVLSNDIIKDGIINTRVFSKYCEIEFNFNENIDSVASANAIEISASSMVDENGELKENTIGAMKEFITLGIKSLKTDFDIEVKDEIKDQVDFVDKDFKNKKLLTIGGKDKTLSFEKDAQKVAINSGEMPSLPLAYRLAKKCKKRKTLSKILTFISAIFTIGIIILPIFKLAGYALYLSAGGVFIALLASVVGLLNLKN